MDEEKLKPYPTKIWGSYSKHKYKTHSIAISAPRDTKQKKLHKKIKRKCKFKLCVPTNYRASQLRQNQIHRSRTKIGWSKNAIARMKRRSRLFNIAYDESITPEYICELMVDYCPAIGIKLFYGYGHGKVPGNASIDRIDNNKGYISGNLQVLSRRANTMKSNASKDELIKFANWILTKQSV